MPRHGRDSGLWHSRVGKEEVGPRVGVEGEAPEDVGQAMGGERIGAGGLDDEGWITAGGAGGVDFSTISSAGMTSLPLMCPQRFGHVWSSISRPAPPACSKALVVCARRRECCLSGSIVLH